MGIKTVKVCDICERFGEDVPLTEYDLRVTDGQRYTVLLCEDHRTPMQTFIASATPTEPQRRKRHSFSDFVVGDPSEIPKAAPRS